MMICPIEQPLVVGSSIHLDGWFPKRLPQDRCGSSLYRQTFAGLLGSCSGLGMNNFPSHYNQPFVTPPPQ